MSNGFILQSTVAMILTKMMKDQVKLTNEEVAPFQSHCNKVGSELAKLPEKKLQESLVRYSIEQ